MKRYGIGLLILFSFSPTALLFSQLSEYGLSLGVLGSRYTVGETRPSENLIVRQGNVFAAGSFGLVGVFSAAKDQPVNYLKLYSSFVMETNYCYCGGNVELLRKVSGKYQINTQEYRLQQLNFKTMYMGRLNKFIFLAGPTASYNFDRKVKVSKGELRSSAYKINTYALGVEFGVGFRFDKFIVSSRYHTTITDFSKNTSLVDTQYNLHEIKLVLTYLFLEKHIGKNWGSIYW